MQRYCLETSFVIDFLREKGNAIEKYRVIKKQKLETTSVVAWEILRGPKLYGRVKEYNEAIKFLERLNILPFTLTSSRIASEIELDLKEKGRSVNLIDVLIAAVAIENNTKLVTRDEGYMNIEGIEVEFY
ncbi:MAG: type II toxin-antitoxin system VapC family toxin [Halobacteriota archaeon]